MILTKGVKQIIEKLNSSNYEAYAVGGAVRDYYLKSSYSDIDVTTSATPEEMYKVFDGFKIYPTGIKHGTLTICSLGEMIEVTTFRYEEGYTDNRRPDKVIFVRKLVEDLKRRDFTVNAMAYNDEKGVIDLFGGLQDLENRLIRAVGNAEERFKEDALRILRALRFASKLNFEIEKETEEAILKCKDLLKNVSKERIYSELIKILMGDGVERVLLKYKEVFFTIIPKLKDCDGFSQQNKYHLYDVYTHIVKSIANSKKDKDVRLALLFHDIGKPDCFTVGEDGVGHFYGHHKTSVKIANEILKDLKVDNFTIRRVGDLIYLHDTKTELTRAEVKKSLNKYGLETLEKLCYVKLGDALAHNEVYMENRIASIEKMLATAKDIVDKKECYTLKQLKINGSDLKKLGYSGEELGIKLNKILNDVIEDKIANEKEILLKEVK